MPVPVPVPRPRPPSQEVKMVAEAVIAAAPTSPQTSPSKPPLAKKPSTASVGADTSDAEGSARNSAVDPYDSD